MLHVKARKRLVRLSITLGAVALLTLVFAIACDRWIAASAKGRVFNSVAEIPARDVALVLGANPITRGHANQFFTARMDAAAALYASGKVRHLIVSGDNHTADYDEPTAMRDALIARGVPASDITLDYAGFRTLDSVVRARDVFGQQRLVIVSQPFHCARALFIAQSRGIDAIAHAASDVTGSAGLRARAREVLARTIAVLDTRVFGTEPHFPGPAEPINLAGASGI